ncbi:MAG: tetratricopeptide repeat protein [Bacteroidota bacterium]
MKNLKTSLLAAITLVSSLGAFANDPESKTVEKARDAVESSSSNWKVLAESAEKCFRKGQNVDQAMEWINKSIEINPDPMNHEIKGDYYKSQNQYKKAMEQYFKAIVTGKEQNFWFDDKGLQKKIWDSKTAIEKLESRGAYYESMGKNNRAIEAYYHAIVAKKENNVTADVSDLQQKIWDLR